MGNMNREGQVRKGIREVVLRDELVGGRVESEKVW